MLARAPSCAARVTNPQGEASPERPTSTTWSPRARRHGGPEHDRRLAVGGRRPRLSARVRRASMQIEGWNVIDEGATVLWREYSFTKGATATTLVFRGVDGLVVVSPGSGI